MRWMRGERKRGSWWFPLVVLAGFQLFGCVPTEQYLDKGKQYASEGDWDKSVQFYQEAHQKYPDDPEVKLMLSKSRWNASLAHMARGELLLRRKLYDEAISEFQMSIAFSPGNAKARALVKKAKKLKESDYRLKQGKDFLKAKEYRKAREAFLRALELNPENEDAQKALDSFRKEEERPPKYRLKPRTRAPISLKFRKTPIVNVFEVLTRLTGVNFIFDKDLPETKVTLFMTDVPFERFLEVLLKTNRLNAKLVDEKTMIIYPDTPAKLKEYEDLQIRTFYLSNLKVKKAVALLAKILKSKDISANEKLNAVVIRGPKELLEVAAKVIEANDRAPAETVLNVELLEVSRKKEKQLGIEFNPYSVTIGLGESASQITEDAKFVNIASLSALAGLSSKEVLLSIPTATLHLLKQDSDTKTLANPQVRVKNGEKATVHIGERVPLRVNRRIDTTGVVTNDFQYTDIGVKLVTEPTINVHDEITLKLSLEVSALGPNIASADDPQFAILTRTAQTVLSLRDGEPVILGGLIQDSDRETVRKVPLLGDIPALGHLFSSTERSAQKTDILMAITPIIVRPQEVPAHEITKIWSGEATDFSLREPFESLAERRAAFLERPKKVEVHKRASVARSRRAKAEKGRPRTQVRKKPEKARARVENPVKPKTKRAGPLPVVQQGLKEASVRRPKEISPEVWPISFPYSIHVSSFRQRRLAQEETEALARRKYDSFWLPANVPKKGRFYRVYVGKYRDFRSAQEICSELRQRKGFAKDIHVVTRRWALGG